MRTRSISSLQVCSRSPLQPLRLRRDYLGNPHAVVVHVRSTSDVVDIVTLCGKHRVPIVVYSGGTSLEGNLSGVRYLFSSAMTTTAIHELDRLKAMGVFVSIYRA